LEVYKGLDFVGAIKDRSRSALKKKQQYLSLRHQLVSCLDEFIDELCRQELERLG